MLKRSLLVAAAAILGGMMISAPASAQVLLAGDYVAGTGYVATPGYIAGAAYLAGGPAYFGGPVAGPYVPGYALAIEPFSLAANELRAGVRVQLVRPPRVSGRLVGADGAPLAKARVFVVGDGPLADAVLASWAEHRPDPLDVGAAEPSVTLGAAWTDAAGAFVLGRLPPGLPLRLVVHHPAAAQLVQSLPALQSGERLELPPWRASAGSR